MTQEARGFRRPFPDTRVIARNPAVVIGLAGLTFAGFALDPGRGVPGLLIAALLAATFVWFAPRFELWRSKRAERDYRVAATFLPGEKPSIPGNIDIGAQGITWTPRKPTAHAPIHLDPADIAGIQYRKRSLGVEVRIDDSDGRLWDFAITTTEAPFVVACRAAKSGPVRTSGAPV